MAAVAPRARRVAADLWRPGALGEHSWNDLVVDGRGNAYVNNIGFDFPDGESAPGFVVLVTPDGSARQVATAWRSPTAWR
jgi:hypothetical protein